MRLLERFLKNELWKCQLWKLLDMRNAYIITHQNQTGNIKIVCNLKVSPEGIVRPKVLLEVNFENSTT